jgi:DNA-binding transcriptional MerR regulator
MVLRDYLRTIDLARAGGISVQQVRNYEALGLLPPASRSKSGYRLYTQRHLAALKTARSLVGGYGWQRMPTIMQALHRGDLGAALTTIDTRHGEQALKRRECEQTLSAWICLSPASLLFSYESSLRIPWAALRPAR